MLTNKTIFFRQFCERHGLCTKYSQSCCLLPQWRCRGSWRHQLRNAAIRERTACRKRRPSLASDRTSIRSTKSFKSEDSSFTHRSFSSDEVNDPRELWCTTLFKIALRRRSMFREQSRPACFFSFFHDQYLLLRWLLIKMKQLDSIDVSNLAFIHVLPLETDIIAYVLHMQLI